MTAARRPVSDMWCDECNAWTRVRVVDRMPECSQCGEPYHCGDCGFEVDRAGRCLRATNTDDTTLCESERTGERNRR